MVMTATDIAAKNGIDEVENEATIKKIKTPMAVPITPRSFGGENSV